MLKLNIGCGDVYFDGWVNIDLEATGSDLLHDVRKRLPYNDGEVSFIYNEHFIEHLSLEEGKFFLSECYRVLKVDGVLRISTPDLDYLIWKYVFRWKKQDWIKEYGYEWLGTKAEMINLAFREWGHLYLYNKEELIRRLEESGFSKIKRKPFGKSSHSELNHRETRRDSKLIVEAIK